MGWGDYFYYCYYYYYYYNYYLKKTTQNKTTDKKRRRHANISQVPTAPSAARRVWGEANVRSTRSPGTDRRTDGRRSGSPALEDGEGRDSGARRSLGRAWMLAMEDTSPSPRMQTSPGGRRGARCLGGLRAPGCPAPGEGRGGQAQPCHLPAPFCCPAPWCGQRSAHPGFVPRQGQTLQPRAGGSLVSVHFFASGSGGLGGCQGWAGQ